MILAQIKNGSAETTAPMSQLVETRKSASRRPIASIPVPPFFQPLLPSKKRAMPIAQAIPPDHRNASDPLFEKLIAIAANY